TRRRGPFPFRRPSGRTVRTATPSPSPCRRIAGGTPAAGIHPPDPLRPVSGTRAPDVLHDHGRRPGPAHGTDICQILVDMLYHHDMSSGESVKSVEDRVARRPALFRP